MFTETNPLTDDGTRTLVLVFTNGNTLTIDGIDFFDTFDVARFFLNVFGGVSDGGMLVGAEIRNPDNEPIPDEIGFDLPVYPEPGDDPDDMPCYRQLDPTDGEFWCAYDHTGCLYNNGHNTCSHEGTSSYPMGVDA